MSFEELDNITFEKDEPEKKNFFKPIIIILILFLIGFLAYQYFTNNDFKDNVLDIKDTLTEEREPNVKPYVENITNNTSITKNKTIDNTSNITNITNVNKQISKDFELRNYCMEICGDTYRSYKEFNDEIFQCLCASNVYSYHDSITKENVSRNQVYMRTGVWIDDSDQKD